MYASCGGLNVLGPWEVLPLWSVALLEKVHHHGGYALRSPSAQALPTLGDAEHSAPSPVPYMSGCCHASCQDDNRPLKI